MKPAPTVVQFTGESVAHLRLQLGVNPSAGEDLSITLLETQEVFAVVADEPRLDHIIVWDFQVPYVVMVRDLVHIRLFNQRLLLLEACGSQGGINQGVKLRVVRPGPVAPSFRLSISVHEEGGVSVVPDIRRTQTFVSTLSHTSVMSSGVGGLRYLHINANRCPVRGGYVC